MRPEKQLLLDDIKEKINHSKGFVLTRYSKMDPNLASQFRTALHQTGGDFEVIRKRILLKAAEAAGCTIRQLLFLRAAIVAFGPGGAFLLAGFI